MSTGEELYGIVVAANVELQNLLSLLLSIYAEEHALINPPIAGTNELHTLLSTHIVPLVKVIKPYVCMKLFISKKYDVILPLVDAKKLDSSLLFDILLKVEDILSINHTIGNCKNCIGTCCNGCNHISPGCKKCKGYNCTPTKKRLHPCQRVSCTKILQECKKHEMICCTSCNTCIACNKTGFESDVKAILSNPSTPLSTCSWYTFIHSLEMAKCFRDLFGHVTIEECEEFTTNGVALNTEFENFKKLEEIEKYLQFLFQHIVDHSKTKLQKVITNASMIPSRSPAKLKELNTTKERLNKTMGNLKCIFEHGESLKKYLADKGSKIKEIFMDDQRFYERLEVLVTRFETTLEENKKQLFTCVESGTEKVVTTVKDQQRKNDRRNKVKVVRRLNKGFVLKLPLAEHEDVKVGYKRDSDGDESWTVVDADQKRDGGVVYLRVEGLPHAGDFQVLLTLSSKGVSKEEIQLSVKVIENVQWKTTTADGHLTIVALPNRNDGDILSFCDHLDQNNCMQKTTTLTIKLVNDAEPNKEIDTEFDQGTDDVSDDELNEQEERLDAGHFSEKGLRYLERNFVKFDNVITFPPLNMIKDDLTREIFGKFADLLKQESKPGLRLLLSNYDDEKFSQFIHVAKDRMLFDGAVPATNRLLLFYLRFATIVNARIVKDKVDIHHEMANCINDLKLFSCTFKFIINNNVIVTALLVCPHLSRAEVEEEMEFYFNKGEQSKRLMKYFFLTKDELESNEDESNERKSKLTEWWYVFRKRLKMKIFNSIENSMDAEISSEMFKVISGQCMATIACCDVENKSMLPTTSDDPQKQILTLLLTNAQLDAIYAPEEKKLVYGPYGCGKSIIAESIVRNIYDEALSQDKKCSIVYAIQDDHSLLEVKNRRFVDGLKAEMKQRGNDTVDNGSCSNDLVSIESGTFHSLAGQSAVGSNSLLHFVKSVIDKRNTFGSINFVIDEVDHDTIEGEDGIEEFKKLLKSVDHFVIFPRSAHLQVQSPGKEKLQQESNLHRLGLKSYALEVVMRNSVEVVNLAESSQKTVKKSKSILQYPSTPFHIMDAPKQPKAPDLSNTSISYSLIESKRRRSHEEEFTAGNLNPEESLVHLEVMRETMQVDNANKVNVNYVNAAKHFDKQNPSSFTTLELDSTFIRCIPGHKVMKRKPNLINLPETFDLYSTEGAKILSIVLDKVCLKDFKVNSPCGRCQSAIFDSPIIICNDMKEVEITYYALTLIPRLEDCYVVYAPDLRRKYFSWKEKEPIYDAIKLRNQILIADNCSMRGMESRHIITFINPLEKFDRHVLPEVITRANVSLDIISFPVDKTAKVENKAATLEDVVNDWLGKNRKMAKSKKLVDVIEVRALLNRKNSREMCSKVKNRLIIQVRSAQFKNYGCGNPTFEQFLDQKQEELSTEELKRTDYDRTFSKHAKKLSPTEDANHSSPNVASTSTSAVQPAVAERTGDSFFDENAAHITLKELDDLLENKSTRNKFNEIIESNPSLTKLRDDDNDTLLHEAAFHGATECVEVLIKNGSDVKEDNKYGSMAIHLAAINNHTQVMKILLSHDPSLVNVEDNDDYTPLHHAACGNHREVVELLLSQPSVDVNVRDRWIGKTPDERTDDDQIKKMIRSHRNYSTS